MHNTPLATTCIPTRAVRFIHLRFDPQWTHTSLIRHIILDHRYLNTGVVFVRVRNDAVAQLERWVAIMDSGVIKCHPWDQAGLQWMFAHAVSPDFPVSTECKPKQCGAPAGEKFYSCGPRFERELIER
jgi:hypothetical protein